ncbi:MAG: DUF222 domain-containing protein [Acidimicrobiia bacterium]
MALAEPGDTDDTNDDIDRDDIDRDDIDRDDIDRDDIGPLGAEYLQRLNEINRLEGEASALLAEFDASGEWGLDGSATCQAWMRTHARMTSAAASARVKTARRLRNLPEIRDAFRTGEISYDHARVLALATDLLDGLSLSGSGVDAEVHPEMSADGVADQAHGLVRRAGSTFLEAARTLDPTATRRVVQHWRHAVEPALLVSEETANAGRRTLHMSQTIGGRWVMNGEFDAESGSVVATALDALTSPDPPDAPHRTAGRKAADAMVEGCRQLLNGGMLPTVGGQRPHVTVTVGLETLERRVGAPPATLESGGPLSGEAARRLACDAGVTRVITCGESLPVDIGRTTKTVPAHIRRGLVVRDHGCAWPGCDRPPGWCDAHHIVHWADGGDTSIENCVLVCRRHHTAVHEHGWRIRLTDDGHLEVEPP